MIKNALTFLMILFAIETYSQADSLQKEILDYPDSKTEIISKGRKLLLDKFLADDFSKVKKIKDYLITDVDNQDYAAFYPEEYWLVLYWTQEYNVLIQSITGFDSIAIVNFNRKIKPQYDMFFEKVRNKSRESRLQVESNIKDANLKSSESDFLLLFFSYLIAAEDYAEITQDNLNAIADNFLNNYPESEYEKLIRTNIRYKYVPSKWGFAFEFFSGYGIFTDELTNSFTNNIPIGIAFDIEYNNFVLYLRDYIGFSKTKNDTPYNYGIWEKDSQVRVFLPEATLGYVAFDNKSIKIAPFAGIASTDIGPTEYDLNYEPDLENVELKFTTTYTVGLNFDIKLGKSKTPMLSYGAEQNFWFLRLRYAYNLPQFENNYDGFNGNMHYITIGIGGFGRKIKREY